MTYRNDEHPRARARHRKRGLMGGPICFCSRESTQAAFSCPRAAFKGPENRAGRQSPGPGPLWGTFKGEDEDGFGRWLCTLWAVEGGIEVNLCEKMVAAGMAEVYTP